jgi:hypothetical protein
MQHAEGYSSHFHKDLNPQLYLEVRFKNQYFGQFPLPALFSFAVSELLTAC